MEPMLMEGSSVHDVLNRDACKAMCEADANCAAFYLMNGADRTDSMTSDSCVLLDSVCTQLTPVPDQTADDSSFQVIGFR